MPDTYRHGTAIWRGDLMNGTGSASTESGVLKDAKITFTTRFEEPITGSNPEELIAAAHAACFSMALSGVLAGEGHVPDEIRTTATITLRKGTTGFRITKEHLDTEVKAPGIDESALKQAAEKAKDTCPVSVLLKPGLEEMTLEARLAQ